MTFGHTVWLLGNYYRERESTSTFPFYEKDIKPDFTHIVFKKKILACCFSLELALLLRRLTASLASVVCMSLHP